jgi:hypothetical protein
MRVLLPLALLLPAAALAAPQAVPQSTVPPPTVVPTRIDVKTSGTLSEVLERISRQTGMKVTYEGGTPRTRVTTNLTGVTPAQAVVSVMEGLDLNYLMGLDAASNRVETLLVVSRSGTGSRPPARSAASAPRLQPREDAMPPEDEPEEDPMAGAVMEGAPADPAEPMAPGGQPPPGSGPGANQNIDPARGAGDTKPQQPQPFQPPAPPSGIGWSKPPGIGWSAPPGMPSVPPGAAIPPTPQPAATPPPNQ